MNNRSTRRLVVTIILLSGSASAQNPTVSTQPAQLQLHIQASTPGQHRAIPAVLWLQTLPGHPPLPLLPHGTYTLLQKNRTFTPHLQVIPVGAVVRFPNADPFFHNVFSLFDGRRFDLGLYEAGSSKSVTFSREGVSYIFCNIHPEMSAVVIALSSPLYATADSENSFILRNIPPGDYTLHLWIEGVPQTALKRLTRQVHITSEPLDLGTLALSAGNGGAAGHKNKFGNSYPPPSQSDYDH